MAPDGPDSGVTSPSSVEQRPSPPRGWGRRRFKGAALNLLLVGTSLLFAFIVVELSVRVIAPQQLVLIRPDLWQPVDTLGWMRNPNADLEINTGERTVRLLTDAQGFRIGNNPHPTDGAILLLGDSFMEALQVEHEQSLAGVLEERLPAAVGRSVAVRNGGVGGWSPSQYLLLARKALERDEYSLVLLALYVGNDIVLQRSDYFSARAAVVRHRLRVPRSLEGRELVDALAYPVNDFLEVRSHLFILARQQLRTFRMRAGLFALEFSAVYLRESADSPRWDATAAIVADIAKAALAHGTPTLVVLIPDAIQVAPERLDAYVQGYGIDPASIDIDQPQRRMTAELEGRGIDVVDPLSVFRDAHSRGIQTHGSVDAHFSPEGHRLLAELVERSVIDALRADTSRVPERGQAP